MAWVSIAIDVEADRAEAVADALLERGACSVDVSDAQAGSIAEKYHFLVIGSFPVNFSETAARRLRNIAANGARCGA